MYIVKITDGLGNQMFQYAFARSLQIHSGKPVYLDNRYINHEDGIIQNEDVKRNKLNSIREYKLDKFKITLPIAETGMLKHWDYLWNEKILKWDKYNLLTNRGLWCWRFVNEQYTQVNIRPFLPTYYKGYFWKLKYYNDIKSILQREFTLREKIKLPNMIRNIISNENTVSIHVRRGDYLRVGWDISQKSYYPRAVSVIEQKVDRPVFLVFSDDIDWVENNLKIDGNVIFVSTLGFKDYEEIMIMKHCKHNIIANSTYSYWGAYLNSNPHKIVVCPRFWGAEIIPDEWIKI
jgi:hypothetical protein